VTKNKPLYMETTEIPAARTAAEITGLLVECGARSVAMEYGDGGKIVGMSFVLMVGGLPYPFKMPVRTQAVHEIFRKRRIATMRFRASEFEARDKEQSERVAWRLLLRWVQIQLAMIQCGMAKPQEIFAPYLLESGGLTLFEYLEETRFKALPPGKEA
jgi:hypothetical protein